MRFPGVCIHGNIQPDAAVPHREVFAVQLLSVILFALAVSLVQTTRPEGGANRVPSVDSIMARVAANQDRVEKLRSHYDCKEHIRVMTRKQNGKMMREETADYEFVPTSTGPEAQLRSLTGRYWHNGEYDDFKGEPTPDANSWDADYIHDVRLCLTEQSRCTDGAHLFPFTTEEQEKYDFHLIGQDSVEGRMAYRIGFAPKNKEMYLWTGEALIDNTDFQPIRVFTKFSRRVPFFVRHVMGTNLSGFGYELDYKRDQGGDWFPAAYGTEYKLHLFFHINRTITVSMDTSFVAVGKSTVER